MKAGINELVMELCFCWKCSDVENEHQTFTSSAFLKSSEIKLRPDIKQMRDLPFVSQRGRGREESRSCGEAENSKANQERRKKAASLFMNRLFIIFIISAPRSNAEKIP